MALSRLVLATAIAAASATVAFAPQASAADGTITITGTVIATTCSVSNGTNGNISVTLPVVQTTELGASGSTAGATPFELDLTGCPTTPSGVQVAAQLSATNVDTTTGNLINGGSAANVQVQLLDQNDAAIDVSTTPDTDWQTIGNNGEATLAYTAQYYATDAAGAGDVNTSAEYTLVYQ